MRCAIESKDRHIQVINDFSTPVDMGEVAHFITELEIMRQQLIILYDKLKKGV
jgi:hypothetical protein